MSRKICNFCHGEYDCPGPHWRGEVHTTNGKTYYRCKLQKHYSNKKRTDKIPEHIKGLWKQWYSDNKDTVQYKRTQRRKQIPSVRLAHNLRCRLREKLNAKKTGSHVKDLGCSVDHLRLFLESQFQHGMSWNNYGIVWEIDHVVPLSFFDLSDRTQLLEACNYLNLQPLFVNDNRRKGGSI